MSDATLDHSGHASPKRQIAAVLLSSGDLPALVCARLLAEEGATFGIRAMPHHEQALAAIHAQAELLEAPILGVSNPADPSTLLLAAARHAAAAGATRLIWPIAVDADLDQLTTEADRAVLISRLIALEPDLGPAAGAGRFEVQTPLLDLSDAQVAEVAIDLDVPVWRCWWWPATGAGRTGPLTCSEVSASQDGPSLSPPVLEAAKALAQRWTTALRAVGWSEDIELASITSG